MKFGFLTTGRVGRRMANFMAANRTVYLIIQFHYYFVRHILNVAVVNLLSPDVEVAAPAGEKASYFARFSGNISFTLTFYNLQLLNLLLG